MEANISLATEINGKSTEKSHEIIKHLAKTINSKDGR